VPKPSDYWLDAQWRGTSLADLPPDIGLDGISLEATLRRDNPASLDEILSVSFVTQRGRELMVMCVGRAARFADFHPRRRALGGLGVVGVAFTPSLGSDAPVTYRITESHALADLSPRLSVSLVDRLVVLELPGLGLRRTFPAGVGALDAIQARPDLTSLTPLTQRARVGREASYEHLSAPAWVRGMPYLTIQIPWVSITPGPVSVERRWYAKTRLAFHVWPGKTFTRGFNSRGCITLRDPDLVELSAFVFGARGALPLQVHDIAYDDVAHPFPLATDHYWRLVDVGRPGAPAFTTRGGLYHIEKVLSPPPSAELLVGRYFDSERRAYRDHQLAWATGIPESLLP
jgi:hypothetical protein